MANCKSSESGSPNEPCRAQWEPERVAGRGGTRGRFGRWAAANQDYLDKQRRKDQCSWASGHPRCRSLQRAGRGTDRKTSRRGEGGNRGQVPRAGSARCPVLDGDLDARGRSKGNGVPVQPEPPECRRLACPVCGCDRRQPGAVPSAVQDPAPDRACQCALPLSRNRSDSLNRSAR